jgi:hypothetical protein
VVPSTLPWIKQERVERMFQNSGRLVASTQHCNNCNNCTIIVVAAGALGPIARPTGQQYLRTFWFVVLVAIQYRCIYLGGWHRYGHPLAAARGERQLIRLSVGVIVDVAAYVESCRQMMTADRYF